MNLEDFRLADVVPSAATTHPERPMLRLGDTTLTYGDVDRRTDAVARALTAAGVSAGDRIAIMDKNGLEFWDVLFGAAKLGAVLVSVNWRLAPGEVAHVLRDAGARVLVVGSEFYGLVEPIASDVPSLGTIVALGEHASWPAYEDWLASAPSERPPAVAYGPDDVVLQLYTSGTTGLPKGAMITNRNLSALVQPEADEWEMTADAVSLAAMPLFHIGGCGWALLGMVRGALTVLMREPDPVRVLDLIESEGITHAFLVPALMQFMTAVPGAAERDTSRFAHVFYGASPITEAALLRVMRTFPHTKFHQVYGLTETTGAITHLAPEDHDPDGPRAHLLRSAGKPFPWVELAVVNPMTGEPLPPGEVGEVWTRSTQNSAGYHGKPEATAEVFRTDGWFCTGDAGYLDAEGYLFITDRIKDMIITGGENVYPVEVENVLAGHPAVGEVAVIGVPDEKWGESVKAVVVPAPGAEPGADLSAEIISYARERLAHYKCPRTVDFIDALPRNPSGKVLKRELRGAQGAGPGAPSGQPAVSVGGEG